MSGFAEGNAATAQFRAGSYLATNPAGDLIVSDGVNNRIRKISNGQVSTIAGSGTSGFKEGTGTDAELSFPGGIAIDRLGNIFVADRGNHRVRKITPAGIVTTLAGSGTQGDKDGNPNEAQFTQDMRDLVVDPDGNRSVAARDAAVDHRTHRPRRFGHRGGSRRVLGVCSRNACRARALSVATLLTEYRGSSWSVCCGYQLFRTS